MSRQQLHLENFALEYNSLFSVPLQRCLQLLYFRWNSSSGGVQSSRRKNPQQEQFSDSLGGSVEVDHEQGTPGT